MPKVYVYDSYDNKFFRYTLRENDPMPYSTDTTLRVREFRGSSKSNVLWTTTAAMEAWNPPHLRQRYPGGVRLQAHLGGRPRHNEPALCGRGVRRGAEQHCRKSPQNLQRRCADRGVGLRGAAVDDTHLGTL